MTESGGEPTFSTYLEILHRRKWRVGSMILSRYAGATLMIAEAGQTHRGELRRATEKLDRVSAIVLGHRAQGHQADRLQLPLRLRRRNTAARW
jgi:hypothetical protein